MSEPVEAILQGVPGFLKAAYRTYPDYRERPAFALLLAAVHGTGAKLVDLGTFGRAVPPGGIQSEATMDALPSLSMSKDAKASFLASALIRWVRHRLLADLQIVPTYIVTTAARHGLPPAVAALQEQHYATLLNADPPRHDIREISDEEVAAIAEAQGLDSVPESFTVVVDRERGVAVAAEVPVPDSGDESAGAGLTHNETAFYTWNSPQALALHGLYVALKAASEPLRPAV